MLKTTTKRSYDIANPVPNPCALIGSFSVRILQFGPFPCIFVLERSRQIQNLQPKQRKKKTVNHLSFFTLKLPEEAKKIEIFPKFQR